MLGSTLAPERILRVVKGGSRCDDIVERVEIAGGEYLPSAPSHSFVLVFGHDSGLSVKPRGRGCPHKKRYVARHRCDRCDESSSAAGNN